MSELTLFSGPDEPAPEGVYEFRGNRIRTVILDGNPWFIAQDSTRVLDLASPRTTLALLDPEEKGVHTMDTPGGRQRFTIVSESGLYALIFRSRKPEAEDFRRWVTREVLPSIRRTGGYRTPEPRKELSNRELALMVIAEADRAERAERLAIEQAPKVQAHDRFMATDGVHLIGDVAKLIGVKGMGQNNLYAFLRERRVLISDGERRNVPMQRHVDLERFVVKVGTRLDHDGDPHPTRTTYATPKGIAFIRSLLADAGYDA